MLEITSRSDDAGPRTEIAIAAAAFPRRADSMTSVPRPTRRERHRVRVARAVVSTTVTSKLYTGTVLRLHQHRATARAVTHDDSGSTVVARVSPQNHPTIPHPSVEKPRTRCRGPIGALKNAHQVLLGISSLDCWIEGDHDVSLSVANHSRATSAEPGYITL